eukprot:268882_1
MPGKNQTPLDRAKFQLLQIYGTWFSVYVACLDFKDIRRKEMDKILRNTFDILYHMTDANNQKKVELIPDELIYKACLILCGKFGKKKEAAKLFKDIKINGITPSQKTYGAYTNAMAASATPNMVFSVVRYQSTSGLLLAGNSRAHKRSFAPTVDQLNANKSVEIIHDNDKNNNNDIELFTEINNNKSTSHSKRLMDLNNSISTSTPSQKIEDAPSTMSQLLTSTNINDKNKTEKPEQIVSIDYSTVEIECKHECRCGYILSDAQIMVGWCTEFTVTSNKLRCIMCRQNTFSPQLHLRYNIMLMQSGICSTEPIDKFIEYISPLQLRSKINFILQYRRLDFEDPETFRANHCDEFWN